MNIRVHLCKKLLMMKIRATPLPRLQEHALVSRGTDFSEMQFYLALEEHVLVARGTHRKEDNLPGAIFQ